jgi:hypothetical protein
MSRRPLPFLYTQGCTNAFRTKHITTTTSQTLLIQLHMAGQDVWTPWGHYSAYWHRSGGQSVVLVPVRALQQ